MNQARLKELLDAFEGKRIVVVGDCMLDEYIWGSVNRISPEAPVMVIEQERTTYAAGGASNVSANIVAMDAAAEIVAVVGRDAMADRLRQELARQGVGCEGLVAASDRRTTVKTRIIAHSQQVVRVDHEDRRAISAQDEQCLLAELRAALASADALLFSDYNKGVLTEGLVAAAARLAAEVGRPAIANPKPPSIPFYRGIDLISVNQSEAELATGVGIEDQESLRTAGARLLEIAGCRAAFITRGGQGIAVFAQDDEPYLVRGIPQEVYDVAGAGDSVIAAAALARLGGATWPEAAHLANYAGNAKVRKLGVVPVSRHDIETVWAHARLNGYR